MFEVSWSHILLVGIVALVVVGPKELPVLLRTLGRYMGMVKRQAAEFRAQFDEAMRESELDQLRKEVESIKSDTENSIRSASSSMHDEFSDVRREIEAVGASASSAYEQPGEASIAAPAGVSPALLPGAGGSAAMAAAAAADESATASAAAPGAGPSGIPSSGDVIHSSDASVGPSDAAGESVAVSMPMVSGEAAVPPREPAKTGA